MTAAGQRPAHVPARLVRRIELGPDLVFDTDSASATEALRGRPLWWTPANGGCWVPTRDADIRAVLTDSRHFSSAHSTAAGAAWPRPLIPAQLDPPEHGKYRSIFRAYLSRTVVDRIAAALAEEAEARIDRFHLAGCCEVHRDFAHPLQQRLFGVLYGVGAEAAEACAVWTVELLRRDHGNSRARAATALAAFLHGLIAERRTGAGDGADILTALLNAELDGTPLSDEQVLDAAVMMALASLDTLAASLVFAFGHLAGRPHERRLVAEDRGALAPVAEELLRLYPVAVLLRTVSADHRLCGTPVRRGDRVLVLPALANRDPGRYADPLAARPDRRNGRQHLTFGTGPHICLGAAIARRALIDALRLFHRRIPRYRIAPGAELTIRPGVVVALDSLPLTWDPQDIDRSGPID